MRAMVCWLLTHFRHDEDTPQGRDHQNSRLLDLWLAASTHDDDTPHAAAQHNTAPNPVNHQKSTLLGL